VKIYRMSGLICVFLATLLTSCGGGDSSSGNSFSEDESSQRELEETDIEAQRAASDGENIQGRLLANFTTLNPQVVGTIPGSAQFIREDNKLSAFVRLFAGSPSIAHFQNVHTGTRCPTIDDDKNGDGYLDIVETLKVVGPVVVPLDWDIGSQLSANRSWPKAFPNGSYEYMKVTRFDRFWDDLKSVDRNPDDNIVKLGPDEGLDFSGKVVIIQGVDESKALPETVAGYGRWTNFQTLPIVCGVFRPYTEDPGVVYEEVIPGPIAPVIEGQDRPAPPGEGENPGTGDIITGGPSNDAGSNDSTSDNDEEDESPYPETGAPTDSRVPEIDTSTTPESTAEPESNSGSAVEIENEERE
jgi:hypothetical protein